MDNRVSAAVAKGKLSPAAATAIHDWLRESAYVKFRDEINQLIRNEDWITLEDGFFKHITFGTGGMRGPVGVGPNRINTRTIGEATQGFIRYFKAQFPKVLKPTIILGYDMRLTHEELSKHCAAVLAANGVRVLRFDGWRATPELSFAVRLLQADGGIVISASHNPPADNGFKAYWRDGAQIVPPHDDRIMAEVAQVTEIKTMDYQEAVTNGWIETIGTEVDDAYYSAVLNESLSLNRSASIVYSPIHGCGQRSLLPVLERAGFKVDQVKEQMAPDGHFPNVPNHIANPEIPSANELTGQQVVQSGADIGLTTDPDADRIAAIVPEPTAESGYQIIGGNTLAVLVTFYVLSTLKERGQLPVNGFLVKTLVTTPMLDAIAADFGMKMYGDTLVGIKYIAQTVREHQDEGKEQFLVGGEESYGMMKGTYCREKDAAVTGLMLAEYASNLKEDGKTLLDVLNTLYHRYGYYLESQIRYPFPGAAGFSAMNRMMAAFRDTPPAKLNGTTIVKITDRVQAADGSFIVRLFLSSDGKNVVTVRPSGTEPIVKFYTALCNESAKGDSDLTLVRNNLRERITRIESELRVFAEKYTR
ncbi:phospho-sugar mutase [Candidatus Berkelbacteria bacterium]|nr:phospho-sugar mutase [Candidatus Berkelbacteria bacterium]